MEKVIVDTKNYSGTIQTVVKDGKSIYGDQTEKEYLDKGLEAMTWPEYFAFQAAFLNSECGKWIEITKAQYEDAMNVLPPLHYESGGFFVSEMYTGNMTDFYQRWDDKYYTSMQRTSYSREGILNGLAEFIRENDNEDQ